MMRDETRWFFTTNGNLNVKKQGSMNFSKSKFITSLYNKTWYNIKSANLGLLKLSIFPLAVPYQKWVDRSHDPMMQWGSDDITEHPFHVGPGSIYVYRISVLYIYIIYILYISMEYQYVLYRNDEAHEPECPHVCY